MHAVRRLTTAKTRSARGLRVQVLEQLVHGKLDLLVPPLDRA
jgi:hypothetical protein